MNQDLNRFLLSIDKKNGRQTSHGKDFIYVGPEEKIPDRWQTFFDGKAHELIATTLDKAEVEAQRMFDKEHGHNNCSVKLQWVPIEDLEIVTIELPSPDFV